MLVASEMVEDSRRGFKGVLFKLEFEKAYDKVNRPFFLQSVGGNFFGIRGANWLQVS